VTGVPQVGISRVCDRCTSGCICSPYHGGCTRVYMPSLPWWVYQGVCSLPTMVGVPGRYTASLPWWVYLPPVYVPVYTPGYTTVHTASSVLPGTLSPLIRVCREGALGSNLRIVMREGGLCAERYLLPVRFGMFSVRRSFRLPGNKSRKIG